jgi:Fe-S-cluster-containing dehydrogenase component/CRP-like cAMP-binding protein
MNPADRASFAGPASVAQGGADRSSVAHSNRVNPIALKAIADVTACIGCNDCMIACPLPQSRNVSIAALNAAVNEATISDASVIDFVTACTQCRQCVPACPADLSRADMVLFNKTKVEDSVADHFLPIQLGQSVEQSRWKLDALASQLTELPLFNGVEHSDVRRLLLSVTLRQLKSGEVLCKAGEFHERLVVVLFGNLEQFAEGPKAQRIPIVSYGPGSFLGEMGVMADQPEPFSVSALQLAAVLEIPKASLRRLMQRSQPFAATMEELYRRRALWTYARSPDTLGGLPEHAVVELFEGAELLLLKQGQNVFREGEAPRDFYLVRSGFLRASRTVDGSERVLTYFREGDVFGLLPLLQRELVHSYSLSASTRAEIIRVPAARLHTVQSRHPAALSALTENALSAERVARSLEIAPPSQKVANIGTHMMPLSSEVLLDMGVAKGRGVLVVDQTKCTYCQNCMKACERRHGESRLQLRGIQLEHLLFPTACRHCEDPQCLLCSVNGIVRRPSGEISIVTENCIGCGACADRCPYGNISMQPVEKPKRGLLFNLLDLLRGPVERAAALAELGSHVPQRAVKCDLCADYADYACVTACPTGAAFRTDASAQLGSAMQRNAGPASRGRA